MTRGHTPGGAIELRRGEIERINESGAQYFKVSGEIEVVNPGEAAISVNFPTFFVDKPAFSFGAQLDAGQNTTLGNLPTCSIVVIAWHKSVRPDGSNIYVGAQFAIVTTGPSDQVMLVQWHMEGVGLRSPVETDD